MGERFNGQENPYPQMLADVSKWRNLMKEGRPISESVETIFKVIKRFHILESTESRVYDNFAEVYQDPTGERFSRGPDFSSEMIA